MSEIWKLFIAVDPGKTSGVATCWYNGATVDGFRGYELDPQTTCDYVWSTLATYTPHLREIHVVMERFTIGPQTLKMSRQHDALELIGAVRWMSSRHGATFSLQDPATAKRMCSNELLRRANMWTRGGEGHANDAARHLVVALVERGWYNPFVEG